MKWKLVALIALTVIVLHLPGIGLFLQAANTMIHETGHAIAGVATGSEVYDIHLFASTEGVTRVAFTTWHGGFLTGIAGYVFASAMAYMLARWWSRHRDHIVLAMLMTMCVVNLLLWVRNPYGIAWTAMFLLLLFVLLRIRKRPFRHAATFVIVLIIVIDSVRSAFAVFLVAVVNPHSAGDAHLLAEMTVIPAHVWGGLFLVQAFLFGWMALRKLWSVKPLSKRAPEIDHNLA